LKVVKVFCVKIYQQGKKGLDGLRLRRGFAYVKILKAPPDGLLSWFGFD